MKKTEMPKPDGRFNDHFIPTLNKTGYMVTVLDPISEAWTIFAAKAPGPALEIGAAYGVASIAALKNGAPVIANDLSTEHLNVLKDQAPSDLLDRLTLLPGKFPDDLSIQPNSIGALLICRVMHFFWPEQIERAAEKIYALLAPGGRAFLVNESPYLKNLAPFYKIFEERKAKGDPWPGLMSDPIEFDPVRHVSLPKPFHLLDPQTIERVFRNAGFKKFLKNEFFARPYYPEQIQMDGRESLGTIVEK